MKWPCGNNKGYMYAREGDGVVIRRPYSCRKTVLSQTSFAVNCTTANNGVCVGDDMDDAKILKRQRSEYGKQIRKDYEAGKVDAQWRDIKEYVQSEEPYSNTISTVTKDNMLAYDGQSERKLRIRYLTPRECLRLQAFPDDAIDRLEAVLGKTALYEVAGNSIAVCCLKAIFKGIYIDRTFRKDRQTSLGRFF